MALPAFFDPIVNAPRSQKFVLGIVGLALLAAGGYFFLLSPLETRVASLRAQETSLQREIAQSRAIVAELARFRKEAAELEKQLVLLTERLPNEKEMPTLYRSLSDAAYQSGLAVSLFQPRDAKTTDYYNEIPIVINAESGYHQLGEFFAKVGNFARVVTVENLKLSGLAKAKNSMKAELTLATYTYRPVGSPPAPKPGTKQP